MNAFRFTSHMRVGVKASFRGDSDGAFQISPSTRLLIKRMRFEGEDKKVRFQIIDSTTKEKLRLEIYNEVLKGYPFHFRGKSYILRKIGNSQDDSSLPSPPPSPFLVVDEVQGETEAVIKELDIYISVLYL